MATTTNYSWEYPDVGADEDTWGALQNTLFSAIDAEVFLKANKASPTFTGTVTISTTVKLSASSDGILLLTDNAGTGFTRLQFGGTTASYPALKRSSSALACVTASDSAYTPFDALEFRVSGTKVVGAQGAAVADATDAASAITQLNALLARLRTHGLIAT